MLKNYEDKFNNLDEMDKSMARHKLPKLTQGEIENEDAPQASRRKETGVCVSSRVFIIVITYSF